MATKKPSPLQDQLKTLIFSALDDHKAEDIVTIDLAGKTDFADYMIIASGLNRKHVSTLADFISKALKEDNRAILSIEGQESGDWVLVDAGDVVVHIFHPEIRPLYNLEKMWSVSMTQTTDNAVV